MRSVFAGTTQVIGDPIMPTGTALSVKFGFCTQTIALSSSMVRVYTGVDGEGGFDI
jgi:hypothetical protein